MSDPLDFLKESSLQRSSSTLRTILLKHTQKVKYVSFLFLAGVGLLLFVIFTKIKGPISTTKKSNPITAQSTSKNNDGISVSVEGHKVSYQIYKQRKPEEKIIVIDPKDISEDRLKLLGNQLRLETQHYSYAHILIYDNLTAAKLGDEIPLRAGEADGKKKKGYHMKAILTYYMIMHIRGYTSLLNTHISKKINGMN